MLKNEIEQKIHNIKSINDATSFVASRVLELDSNVKPTTVGFNYDTSIKDYISTKVRFIAGDIDGKDYPSLLFNDLKPYSIFIRRLSLGVDISDYDKLYYQISLAVDSYLSGSTLKVSKEGIDIMRTKIFAYNVLNNVDQISIRKLASEGLGSPLEKAALIHNILRILDIDSELYFTSNEDIYNIIYPYGYDSEQCIAFPFKDKDFDGISSGVKRLEYINK